MLVKIQLLDVEDRPVALVGDDSERRAFVWQSGGWQEVPGMLAKSIRDGYRMTGEEFAAEFPHADVSKLSPEG